MIIRINTSSTSNKSIYFLVALYPNAFAIFFNKIKTKNTSCG